MGICRPTFLNQKDNVGWSLLRRLLDLFKACSLDTTVETIPTRFCWLICSNQELAQSRILQQSLFVLKSGFWQVYTDFCPLLDVYFNDMQVNK